jgi:hypothetical protein
MAGTHLEPIDLPSRAANNGTDGAIESLSTFLRCALASIQWIAQSASAGILAPRTALDVIEGLASVALRAPAPSREGPPGEPPDRARETMPGEPSPEPSPRFDGLPLEPPGGDPDPIGHK